jgi:hypothetical protein
MPELTDRLEAWAKIAQFFSVLGGVIATVVGVVISVRSANDARNRDADARKQEAYTRQIEAEARKAEAEKYKDQRADEARKQQIEAAKTFLQLRQERYMEIVKAAAVLVNPKDHTEQEAKEARVRFRDLYVAELSMVESREVEKAMMELGKAIDPDLENFTRAQDAAYKLSHALRDSLVKSWGVDVKVIDNP